MWTKKISRYKIFLTILCQFKNYSYLCIIVLRNEKIFNSMDPNSRFNAGHYFKAKKYFKDHPGASARFIDNHTMQQVIGAMNEVADNNTNTELPNYASLGGRLFQNGGSIERPQPYSSEILPYDKAMNMTYWGNKNHGLLPTVYVTDKRPSGIPNDGYWQAHAEERAKLQGDVQERPGCKGLNTAMNIAALAPAIAIAAPLIPTVGASKTLPLIGNAVKTMATSPYTYASLIGGEAVNSAVQANSQYDSWGDMLSSNFGGGSSIDRDIFEFTNPGYGMFETVRPLADAASGVARTAKNVGKGTRRFYDDVLNVYRNNKANTDAHFMYPWERSSNGSVIEMEPMDFGYRPYETKRLNTGVNIQNPMAGRGFNVMQNANALGVDEAGNYSMTFPRMVMERLKNGGVDVIENTPSSNVLEHINAVAKSAQSIPLPKVEGYTDGQVRQALVSSALIHDLGKFTQGDNPHHGSMSTYMTGNMLRSLGIEPSTVPMYDVITGAVRGHMNERTRLSDDNMLKALQLADVARGRTGNEAIFHSPYLAQYERQNPSVGMAYTDDSAINEVSLWNDIKTKINPIIRMEGGTPIKKGTKDEMISAFNKWFNDRRTFVRGVHSDIEARNEDALRIVIDDMREKVGFKPTFDELKEKGLINSYNGKAEFIGKNSNLPNEELQKIAKYNAEFAKAIPDTHARHNTFKGINEEGTGYKGLSNAGTDENPSDYRYFKLDPEHSEAVYMSSEKGYSNAYANMPENLKYIQPIGAEDYIGTEQGLPSEYLFNNDFDIFNANRSQRFNLNRGLDNDAKYPYISKYRAFEIPYRLQTGRSLKQDLAGGVNPFRYEYKDLNHYANSDQRLDNYESYYNPHLMYGNDSDVVISGEINLLKNKYEKYLGRPLDLIAEIHDPDGKYIRKTGLTLDSARKYYKKVKSYDNNVTRINDSSNTAMESFNELMSSRMSGTGDLIEDTKVDNNTVRLLWSISMRCSEVVGSIRSITNDILEKDISKKVRVIQNAKTDKIIKYLNELQSLIDKLGSSSYERGEYTPSYMFAREKFGKKKADEMFDKKVVGGINLSRDSNPEYASTKTTYTLKDNVNVNDVGFGYGDLWKLQDMMKDLLDSYNEFVSYKGTEVMRRDAQNLERLAKKKFRLPNEKYEELISPEAMAKYMDDNGLMTRFDSPSFHGQKNMIVFTTGDRVIGDIPSSRREPFTSTQVAIIGKQGDRVAKIVGDATNMEFTPTNKVLQYGGSIVTPYGQWQYPGKVTTIPSNEITMKNVPYPVLGVSNNGDSRIMYPEREYKFSGDYVTEYPMIEDFGYYKCGGKFRR